MSTSAPPKTERRARTSASEPRSAAAPSPFPPIAEYAFLSNCHTGALIGGRVDRIVLGALRRSIRLACSAACLTGRRGVSVGAVRDHPHPVARAYVAGTNVMVTTWRTPTGWVEVRDAFDDGAARPRGRGDAAYASAGG